MPGTGHAEPVPDAGQACSSKQVARDYGPPSSANDSGPARMQTISSPSTDLRRARPRCFQTVCDVFVRAASSSSCCFLCLSAFRFFFKAFLSTGSGFNKYHLEIICLRVAPAPPRQCWKLCGWPAAGLSQRWCLLKLARNTQKISCNFEVGLRGEPVPKGVLPKDGAF